MRMTKFQQDLENTRNFLESEALTSFVLVTNVFALVCISMRCANTYFD